jgi:hypothetical protein
MLSALRARPGGGRSGTWCGALALAAFAVMALAGPALADRTGRGLGHYVQRDLVSDVPGAAELLDAGLVNAWGLAFSPTSPAWVADNGADVSTLYSGAVGGTPVAKVGLTVAIPGGAPTGAVFNGSSGFVVQAGASSGPARFLFSSEAGTITGWSPAVPPPPPSTQAQTAVSVPGAIFKGLAIADTATGPRIYPSDFHAGQVDVWDAGFAPVQIPGAFRDPALPACYAPSASRPSTRGSSSPTPSRTRTPRTRWPGRATASSTSMTRTGACSVASRHRERSTRRGAWRWRRRASAARAGRC